MTGSYGRHEASEYSDLDIFFVKKGKGKPHGEALSRVDKALMDAAIIKICREIGFPELTGSGRYLDVYLLDDFRTFLGSRKEDYENILTARMLLLLESQSVHGDEVYEQAVQNTIDTYYEDYHGHEEGFLPVFLVNDIQRYWKRCV